MSFSYVRCIFREASRTSVNERGNWVNLKISESSQIRLRKGCQPLIGRRADFDDLRLFIAVKKSRRRPKMAVNVILQQ
jgi:hypothetical protein